jgi:hypothetical protein
LNVTSNRHYEQNSVCYFSVFRKSFVYFCVTTVPVTIIDYNIPPPPPFFCKYMRLSSSVSSSLRQVIFASVVLGYLYIYTGLLFVVYILTFVYQCKELVLLLLLFYRPILLCFSVLVYRFLLLCLFCDPFFCENYVIWCINMRVKITENFLLSICY